MSLARSAFAGHVPTSTEGQVRAARPVLRRQAPELAVPWLGCLVGVRRRGPARRGRHGARQWGGAGEGRAKRSPCGRIERPPSPPVPTPAMTVRKAHNQPQKEVSDQGDGQRASAPSVRPSCSSSPPSPPKLRQAASGSCRPGSDARPRPGPPPVRGREPSTRSCRPPAARGSVRLRRRAPRRPVGVGPSPDRGCERRSVGGPSSARSARSPWPQSS